MEIRTAFCPRCGAPSGGDGLCDRCRVAGTRWLECAPRAIHISCPTCGAIRHGQVWTDSEKEREEIAPALALSAVRLHPEVRRPTFQVTVRELSGNRSIAEVEVSGHLFGEQVRDRCTLELVWQKEQCTRCNRIAGSYHEGVVQVRATGRRLTGRELREAEQIANEIESTHQAEGDRLSFISDLRVTRDGLDIVVGSQAIGLGIAQAIAARLGGRYSTHPKLVGEKAGRPIYRVTYLVRLFPYLRGDVVRVQDTDLEVVSVEGHHLRAVDLQTGRTRTVRENEEKRLIGHSSEAIDALVAYIDGDVIGLLDPETGQTLVVSRPGWLNVGAGDQVRALRDGDRLVVLG